MEQFIVVIAVIGAKTEEVARSANKKP